MSKALELKRNGYIFFSSPIEETMLEVASGIGEIYEVSTMPLVQTLTPRFSENEQKNTYSGNYGLREFPFHTDLAHWYTPPRYLFLRCVSPAIDVATKLVDSHCITEGILKELLNRAHFKPRKRLDRKSNLLKILHDGIFRWDSIFIEPANKTGKDLMLEVEKLLKNIPEREVFLTLKGDCLLIDNWRMLHGRGQIGSISMNRIIERVYFNEVKL